MPNTAKIWLKTLNLTAQILFSGGFSSKGATESDEPNKEKSKNSDSKVKNKEEEEESLGSLDYDDFKSDCFNSV